MDEKKLQSVLSGGVKYGASDIHFRPGSPPLYRIQGKIVALKYDKLLPADIDAITKLFLAYAKSDVDIREIQEFDASYSVPGTARFRVNIYRQRGSLAVVLRIVLFLIPVAYHLLARRTSSPEANTHRLEKQLEQHPEAHT